MEEAEGPELDQLLVSLYQTCMETHRPILPKDGAGREHRMERFDHWLSHTHAEGQRGNRNNEVGEPLRPRAPQAQGDMGESQGRGRRGEGRDMSGEKMKDQRPGRPPGTTGSSTGSPR